ncbi:MAG: hypothetical protein JOY84_02315 [Curvibacter sp.]|nr:hypothetical protein [Curvibacter sp.]
MNKRSTSDTTHKNRQPPFIAPLILLSLLAAYTTWLLAFWPGSMGEDSFALIREIQGDGAFPSGKTAFWYFFVKLLFGPTQRVEVPIGAQLILCAIIFSRILTWTRQNGLNRTFWFLLIFVCLAPHMVFFMGLLYSDGLFSVAMAGLTFEIWLVTRDRKLSLPSFVYIVLCLPFASFLRSNGMIFPFVVMAAAFLLPNQIQKRGLLCAAVIWLAIGGFVLPRLHDSREHGALYPLAVFETANFLQPRPMGIWEESPRVSPATILALTRAYPIERVIKSYDRDYWDPLVYRVDGPQLLTPRPEDRRTIVSEFFGYNLWHNVPAFVSSRINIFLVSALAQGGIFGPNLGPYLLKRFTSNSSADFFQWEALTTALLKIHHASESLRFILWTPFLGLYLSINLVRRGLREKNSSLLLAAAPMCVQAVGIFFFSIAGEYRYLLPFFASTAALLPIALSSQKIEKTGVRHESI